MSGVDHNTPRLRNGDGGVGRELEPQPDTDRLLTDDEFVAEFAKLEESMPMVNMPWQWGKQVSKAQDTKTASIKDKECQERIKGIFEEIENNYVIKKSEHPDFFPDGIVIMSEVQYQSLKDKELGGR